MSSQKAKMICSSISRSVRCEPRAKKIRKTGGIKDCLLFR